MKTETPSSHVLRNMIHSHSTKLEVLAIMRAFPLLTLCNVEVYKEKHELKVKFKFLSPVLRRGENLFDISGLCL